MLQWIQQHSSLLQVIASFGTLAIWIFYAQLLFSSFKSVRTPRILITQGVGTRESSRCMVTNMSKDTVFVQCVVAHLKTNHGHRTCSVTDFESNQSGDVADSLKEGTGQGPLAAGTYLDLGAFSKIVALARQAPLTRLTEEIKAEDEEEVPLALKVYVIAAYSFENGEVGARRRFELVEPNDGGERITRPSYVATQQLRDWRSRRQMRAWLRKFL